MLAIITLVAPVFGLIAIGWAAARVRYVPEAAGPLLSDFAYKSLIPALLFRAMATLAPPAQSPWLLAGAYGTGVVLVWLTATLSHPPPPVGRAPVEASGTVAVARYRLDEVDGVPVVRLALLCERPAEECDALRAFLMKGLPFAKARR